MDFYQKLYLSKTNLCSNHCKHRLGVCAFSNHCNTSRRLIFEPEAKDWKQLGTLGNLDWERVSDILGTIESASVHLGAIVIFFIGDILKLGEIWRDSKIASPRASSMCFRVRREGSMTAQEWYGLRHFTKKLTPLVTVLSRGGKKNGILGRGCECNKS